MSIEQKRLHSFAIRLTGGWDCVLSSGAIYSYLVGCCVISDLFGKGESIMLRPISVPPYQINQTSGKQLTKQLFYYSCPEC